MARLTEIEKMIRGLRKEFDDKPFDLSLKVEKDVVRVKRLRWRR